MLGCCSCTGYDGLGGQGEIQVQLSTDPAANQNTRHPLTRGDSFDITFTPRSFGAAGSSNQSSRAMPITPRQRDLRDQLELPLLHTYPVAPHCSPEDGEEEFALDMHSGMYLTQLTSNRDYSDIHCQLMEDMNTLKLDQSNGRIIEFPLTNVSKVYRIVKNNDKWYAAGSPSVGPASPNTEQIVVVEFMRRKLAFVFKELVVSQRFLICMELLIRGAQQNYAKKALRALTPTFPPQHNQQGLCPTPRQVYDAQPRAPQQGAASVANATTPPRS